MKITRTQVVEVSDPELVIRFNLENNKHTITLTYTCPKCAGHGCGHGNTCDSRMVLEPEDVLNTCGLTTRSPLADIFRRILEAG